MGTFFNDVDNQQLPRDSFQRNPDCAEDVDPFFWARNYNRVRPECLPKEIIVKSKIQDFFRIKNLLAVRF